MVVQILYRCCGDIFSSDVGQLKWCSFDLALKLALKTIQCV